MSSSFELFQVGVILCRSLGTCFPLTLNWESIFLAASIHVIPIPFPPASRIVLVTIVGSVEKTDMPLFLLCSAVEMNTTQGDITMECPWSFQITGFWT